LAIRPDISRKERQMAVKHMTRNSIPQALIGAKQSVIKKFLSSEPTPAFTALSAQSHPRHNLVGVGVGRKLVNGKPTADHCVRFYVERKLDESVIPKEFLLPKRIGGVLTDVIETGRFVIFIPPEQKRLRPVRPGCSIGYQSKGTGDVMAGTLGAIVEADNKRFLLSNNHVLAGENALPIGSPIFQPGLLDKNTPGPDQVASLSHFIKLDAHRPNKVDCAVAQLADGTRVNAAIMPRVNKLKSGAPIAAEEAMKVEKTGRTTGYSTGTIHDVSATVKVHYGLGMLTFADQIMIGGGTKSFSAAGDSGSLIVDSKTRRPVGLLFGGTDRYTVANHINDVLDQLKVAIVA
jgi:hypothetical protein